MDLTIDQTLVIATGNGETDTATGYLHGIRSNKASGPIRGRKVKGSGPRYWNVDYIIDNPFYNAN